MALGAGLMFVFDAARGRRRRAIVRDKARHAGHTLEEAVEKGSRDLGNRLRGWFSEARARLHSEAAPDQVIRERVRARIGRVVSSANAIVTEVQNGRVILSGPILTREAGDLLATVLQTPGVTAVEDDLEKHESAASVPALQGGRHPSGRRFEPLPSTWSPAARLALGVSGGCVAALGLVRRGGPGAALALVGAGLVARAAAGRPLPQLLGLGLGRRAVDIQKTITIRAPLEEVFAFWADFRNFPRFMSHVRDVQVSDDNRRSRWVVDGPAALSVSWDAEMVEFEPNQLLAWRSVAGAQVANAGIVRFERTPDGGTRLQIRMSYNPPAGAIGHAVATILGRSPKREIDDDLLRFKSLIEAGKATGRERQIERDALRRPEGPQLH
jgi:uncharacterized membrane protein